MTVSISWGWRGELPLFLHRVINVIGDISFSVIAGGFTGAGVGCGPCPGIGSNRDRWSVAPFINWGQTGCFSTKRKKDDISCPQSYYCPVLDTDVVQDSFFLTFWGLIWRSISRSTLDQSSQAVFVTPIMMVSIPFAITHCRSHHMSSPGRILWIRTCAIRFSMWGNTLWPYWFILRIIECFLEIASDLKSTEMVSYCLSLAICLSVISDPPRQQLWWYLFVLLKLISLFLPRCI